MRGVLVFVSVVTWSLFLFAFFLGCFSRVYLLMVEGTTMATKERLVQNFCIVKNTP